jgi:hypothetical protein
MAIFKPFETPQKVTATYHKILKAEIDCTTMAVQITLAIYASPEARDSGGTVLWHEYQNIPFAVLTQDPRDFLYPMLVSFKDSYLVGGAATEEGLDNPSDFAIKLVDGAILQPEPEESAA